MFGENSSSVRRYVLGKPYDRDRDKFIFTFKILYISKRIFLLIIRYNKKKYSYLKKISITLKTPKKNNLGKKILTERVDS